MSSSPNGFEPDLTSKPEVQHFFDAQSSTFSYVVKDPGSAACAIVDSVLDIDYAAGKLDYAGADQIIAYIKQNHLQVEWITHPRLHDPHYR